MKVPDAGAFALEICGSCSIYIPNIGEVALIISFKDSVCLYPLS
jgi:hypothetical protein